MGGLAAMIQVLLHNGEMWEGLDGIFDISPLGVKMDDLNNAGIKTGEWTLLPWSSIREIRRLKNPPIPAPSPGSGIPSTDLRETVGTE